MTFSINLNLLVPKNNFSQCTAWGGGNQMSYDVISHEHPT